AGQGGAAAALRPLRQRHRGPAARPAGREPARPGEARLQRGEPGDPGEGTGDQRRLGRLQQGGTEGQGRGGAGGPERRGLRARAREQRGGRRQTLRRALRGVQEGAGGDAQAHPPPEHARPAPAPRAQARPGREGARAAPPVLARGDEGGEAVRNTAAVVVLLVLLALLSFSVYTVSETEQVILTQFGRPVGGLVTEPGLHFKLPFIQDVHRFDKRWLEFDGDPNQIPTRDKKYIWVETYARWRVADPLRFFQAVQDERGGQSRLDDIVDGETRNAVASFDLIELVRSSNR